MTPGLVAEAYNQLMKYWPEILAATSVVCMIGYLLYAAAFWLIILGVCLLSSIIYFLIDQEIKIKSPRRQ